MKVPFYGIDPSDAPTVAATLSLLLAVAHAPSLLPGRRALAVNPLDAMRGES